MAPAAEVEENGGTAAGGLFLKTKLSIYQSVFSLFRDGPNTEHKNPTVTYSSSTGGSLIEKYSSVEEFEALVEACGGKRKALIPYHLNKVLTIFIFTLLENLSG
ncbi:hypothetical protein ACOSP7_000982 [Xanthoceras sorbifolium]